MLNSFIVYSFENGTRYGMCEENSFGNRSQVITKAAKSHIVRERLVVRFFCWLQFIDLTLLLFL